jgi:hypothetical protein
MDEAMNGGEAPAAPPPLLTPLPSGEMLHSELPPSLAAPTEPAPALDAPLADPAQDTPGGPPFSIE